MESAHVQESQQTELERQLLLLVEASSRLLSSPESPDVLNTLLALGQKLIRADAYAVWWRQATDEWDMIAMTGLSNSYSRTVLNAHVPPGLLEAEPVAIEEICSFEPFAHRRKQYEIEGIRSLLIIPLQIRGKPAGTIVFYYRAPHRFSDSEKRLGAALANLAAAALTTADLYTEQKQIQVEAARSAQRATFLAEAGEVISSSLEYEDTLRSIADRAVPFFADWCAVDILDNAEVRRVALKHLDQEKLRLLEYLATRFPPGEDNAILVALRSGKSLLIEEIPDALIAARAKSEEHAALIRQLELKSLIVAPMVVRGRTLGCLTFATAESGRRYSQSDLQLAEEIARRAAIAIENARLYQQVVANEQQWHMLANSIPQLAWMADEKGWLFWYNQRWYDYTGTTFEEMQGWGWEKVHHPDHLQRVVERVSRAWETGDPWEDTFPLRSKDGEWRWFLSRALPIRDASGRVVRWFGTNTDITELRDTQRELESANEELVRVNRDLEQFAYSASHDLKEPLRNVAIYSQMIARRYGGVLDAQGREFLSCVTQNAQRMDALVNDLLAFTQIGNTTNKDQAGSTNATEALEAALANLSSSIAELGADIAYHPLPDVRIARAHLEQLFQNLISNALKYRSDAPPKIQVAARRQEHHWVFSIMDNGIGIKPEYQERIFGIFKRLHTATKYPGTGIGLAICKRIVERYHGRIWVESEPGRGATFFFTLPA
ncbi:MAG TPA: ATP-binding protein [Bryobacteraceae bacterium]|jgi:PAS domain S-box-containing protein|nr:ATP-binding protein [Bryobacteraceae bacterium]